jgi:hypothetical protein
MNGSRSLALFASASMIVIGGCAPQPEPPNDAKSQAAASSDIVTEVNATDLPPAVSSAIASAVPDFQAQAAQRKERDGRVYYDVEGVRADGSEIEFDLLGEGDTFKVVEIQRDIAWDDAPGNARDAAAAAPNAFEPVRVIESTQTDGAVIYELFADGAPAKPSLEVRVTDGKAEVLQEEWQH